MTDVLRAPDDTDQPALSDFGSSVKPDRTGEDLLFQVLLDWGLDLTMPVQKESIDGFEVYDVEEGAVILCIRPREARNLSLSLSGCRGYRGTPATSCRVPRRRLRGRRGANQRGADIPREVRAHRGQGNLDAGHHDDDGQRVSLCARRLSRCLVVVRNGEAHHALARSHGSQHREARRALPNCDHRVPGRGGQRDHRCRLRLAASGIERPCCRGAAGAVPARSAGKRAAAFAANAPIAKTLRPVREESVDFDTTKNLFIEGDNLDALKLLQESYLGKVKLIYIDPPYNTGNDFIYNDDFAAFPALHNPGCSAGLNPPVSSRLRAT